MSPMSADSWTRLHRAVVNFDVDEQIDLQLAKIDVLLRFSSPIDARTSTGNTPLHLACTQDSVDLINLLISRGANVTAVNERFESPLHHSVMHGNIAIVDRLLRSPDIDVDAEDASGCTPLHWALQQTDMNANVIEALIDADAFVNAEDDDGNTPLHYAATEGHLEALELLLENHANPLMSNHEDLTPFHAACSVDQPEIVEHMIGLGAPFAPTMPSRVHKLTPLHLATKVRRSSALCLLLEAIDRNSDVAGDVNVLDAYERTPLHLAAKMGNSPAAAALLRRGANESAKDSFGHSPRWYAKKSMDEFCQIS